MDIEIITLIIGVAVFISCIFLFFRYNRVYQRILVIICYILFCVILVYWNNSVKKYISEDDAKHSNLNLIEYYNHEHDGIRRYNAIVTSDINFRVQPNTNSDIICVISKGEIINVLQFRTPRGEWFNVGYKNQQGWINGKYARVVLTSETGKILKRTIDHALKYTFPENNLAWKIIGVAGGIFISLIFLFRGQ